MQSHSNASYYLLAGKGGGTATPHRAPLWRVSLVGWIGEARMGVVDGDSEGTTVADVSKWMSGDSTWGVVSGQWAVVSG